MANRYYSNGLSLLRTLMELGDDLKHNYQHGDICQKTLANIAMQQCDLCTSYIVLLGEDEQGPIVGRTVVLRTILENQGAILHTKGSSKRSEKYLGYVEKIEQQVRDHFERKQTRESNLAWSTSTIKQRVGLIGESASSMYDMLSNFAHGNNTLYLFDTKELTQAFIKAMDSYSLGILVGLLAELAVGLDMDDAKRLDIFESTRKVTDRYKPGSNDGAD